MDEVLQDIFYIKKRQATDTEGGDVAVADGGIQIEEEPEGAGATGLSGPTKLTEGDVDKPEEEKVYDEND